MAWWDVRWPHLGVTLNIDNIDAVYAWRELRVTCPWWLTREWYWGVQNVHRLFFYLIIPFPIILLWDGLRAFDFPDGFGMGLGTLILLVNAVLLGIYVLSCHSCRHVCGGRIDCLSEKPTRYGLWRFVTRLNERHMLIAWISMVGVAAADLYVRLVATGAIRDLRFF